MKHNQQYQADPGVFKRATGGQFCHQRVLSS